MESPAKVRQSQHEPATVDTVMTVAAAAIEDTEQHIDPIYQNQEDISEYIEDTGIRAIALYDYQAAADDEISFDPDDLITHIEQVINSFGNSFNKMY